MMHDAISEFMPNLWLPDRPPEYSNVWLFKTNRLGGTGRYISRQRCPSGITLRIVSAGRWQVAMTGHTYVVEPGMIFLALPGIYIEFGHTDPDDWGWYELQFNGTAAAGFIQEFGLSGSCPVIAPLRPAAAMRIFRLLHRMLGSSERNATTIMSWVFRLTQVCSPAGKNPPPPSERDLTARAVTLLETDPTGQMNIKELAQRLGVDRSTLGRAFRKRGNGSPHDFLDSYRLMKAEELLQNSALSVAQVAMMAGFRDEKYFISWFRRRTGTPPGRWRKPN